MINFCIAHTHGQTPQQTPQVSSLRDRTSGCSIKRANRLNVARSRHAYACLSAHCSVFGLAGAKATKFVCLEQKARCIGRFFFLVWNFWLWVLKRSWKSLCFFLKNLCEPCEPLRQDQRPINFKIVPVAWKRLKQLKFSLYPDELHVS